MEGSQRPFGFGDQSILDTLVILPKDSAVMADLLDVNDGSGFYGDFQLPEFPCMLSSSTTLPPMKPPGSSSTLLSSSLTSWMALNHDGVTAMDPANCEVIPAWNVVAPEQAEALFPTPPMGIIPEKPSEEAVMAAVAAASSSGAAATFCGVYECMHIMENLGNMTTLESNDMFDPTSIFPSINPFNEEVHNMGNFGLECEDQKYQLELFRQHHEDENNGVFSLDRRCNEVSGLAFSDDIGAVFLEWLQANRGSISPDFLQKVKIKKSTIETAARRLGGGKEAMKQLLKLILQWVQTNHLNQKHTVELSPADLNLHEQLILPNPSPSPNPNYIPAQPVSTTFPDFPDAADSIFASQWALPSSPFAHPNMDPNSAVIDTYSGNESLDFHMVDSMPSWPPAVQWPLYDYKENFHLTMGGPPQGFGDSGYGYPSHYPLQYFQSSGVSSRLKFARLGSAATKEARKNRMARQRQSQSHQHHRISKSRQHDGSHHKVVAEPGGGTIGSDSYSADMSQLDSNANLMYWSPDVQGVATGEHLQVQPAEMPMPENHYHPQSFTQPDPVQQPNTHQGLKVESNLKFLLQKVLKQSDVGNLGRIVLPKKEAEAHLPELDARDGITIAMEDIGTSRVWNMRYRFWPNNKSRMYLLDNTGDFVRANGLKEGDFIVIYLDLKCGKYLIRGVKIRPSEEGARALDEGD